MLPVFLPKVHSADRWPVALQPVAKCHPTKKREAWIVHWKFRTWLNCIELMGCQHKVHKIIKRFFMAVIHSSLGSAGCIPPCSSEKCAAVKSPSRLTVQKGPWWRGVPRARPQSPPASAKFCKAKMLYYALFISNMSLSIWREFWVQQKDVQICLRLGCWTNSQLDRVISYLGQVDLPNMEWRWNEVKGGEIHETDVLM